MVMPLTVAQPHEESNPSCIAAARRCTPDGSFSLQFLDTCMAAAVEGAPNTPWGGWMTKTQLVTKLAEAGGVSRKQGDAILTAFTDLVIKSVKKGENIKVPGLGTFRLRKMKARMGRNPQTGEAIKIPARKKVGFSVAKSFKETVLGKAK
jgi:nucleoid DNA-binding protein